jgi:hypothetical protein
MIWRDSTTESVGQIRDMTVVGLTFIDNDDGTGILTTGGTGPSGGGGGIGTPPWFNVIDYGAVGDGVTLDCDAINDAIDAINAGGRGVLYFPPGTYLCNAGLNAITVPCAVVGEGRGSFGVAASNSRITCSSSTAVLFTVNGGHVSFQGLDIRNSATTPSAGAGIAVLGNALTYMDHCFVKGFYINVDIQEGGAWTIQDCALLGPIKYALKIRNISSPDGGDWSIVNSYICASDARTADAGIRIESAGGGKITNTKFNHLNGSGFFVRGIDLAPAATTSILLVHGNSFENYSGDAIHVETSGSISYDHISIVGNQFGQYANSTGNAIEVTCANVGEVDGLLISSNIFRQTGGGTPVAVNLTKVNDVMLVGNIYELGFAGGNIATSGCTNVVNLDLLGATPSGELGGTWDAITVDATHSGSAHLALGSDGTTAAAGNHTHSGSVPPAALLESGHAVPFTFDEWLQTSDGNDVLWASA